MKPNLIDQLMTWASPDTRVMEGRWEGEARRLMVTAAEEITALRAELAKHQESEFHPDWSKLEATRDALREVNALLAERDAEIAMLRGEFAAQHAYERTYEAADEQRARDAELAHANEKERRIYWMEKCQGITAELAERDAEIAGLRDGLVRIIDAWDGDSESMHDDPAVIARAALAGDARTVEDYIDIVFDGPPGPVAGRFVEVEDSARRSIRFGEWTKRDDGFWVLRVANEQASAHRSAQIRAACQTALRALDTYEAMYRHHMTVQLYSARAGLREALGEWK